MKKKVLIFIGIFILVFSIAFIIYRVMRPSAPTRVLISFGLLLTVILLKTITTIKNKKNIK